MAPTSFSDLGRGALGLSDDVRLLMSTGMLGRRLLREDERSLLQALLDGYPGKDRIMLDGPIIVADMDDGGMGSIRFIRANEPDQRFGDEIAAATYIDQDGVPVSITLNLDTGGDLFEIDLWKTNWSPLVRYPSPTEIKVEKWGNAG